MVESGDLIEFKICLVGDTEVGKTCILNRFLDDRFSAKEPLTLGANFKSKIMFVNPGSLSEPLKVKLNVWDTAGQERFQALTKIYMQGADAVLMAYDITKQCTYESLEGWH